MDNIKIFKRLINEIDVLKVKTDNLSSLALQQAQSTIGITDSRSAAMGLMIKQVVKAAKKAKTWAKDNKNAELEGLFSITSSQFDKLTHSNFLITIKLILKSLQNNIDKIDNEFYRLSAEQIEEIATAVIAYEKEVPAVGNTKSSKKSATQTINIVIDEIDSCVDVIDDLIDSEYGDIEPEFVTEYYANRRLDDVASRHTGALFLVKDTADNSIRERGYYRSWQR